jgi:hypothetical protein
MSSKFHFGRGKSLLYAPKQKRNYSCSENEINLDQEIDHFIDNQNEEEELDVDVLSVFEEALLQSTDFKAIHVEPKSDESKEEVKVDHSFDLYLRGSKLIQGNNNNVICFIFIK